MIRYTTVTRSHLDGILALLRVENWASYTEDPDLTWRALTAAGVTTVVALEGERVVGFAQMQSDGQIQAHLSLILVDRTYRRRGIGRRLIEEALARAGGTRVDLFCEAGAEAFYESFKHREDHRGYRIYPEIPAGSEEGQDLA